MSTTYMGSPHISVKSTSDSGGAQILAFSFGGDVIASATEETQVGVCSLDAIGWLKCVEISCGEDLTKNAL